VVVPIYCIQNKDTTTAWCDGGASTLVKALTTEDRRKIKMINTRRKKGLKWRQIAEELGFNSASHVYNWLNDRALLVDGEYVPIDQVSTNAI
jgi:hypothetical protein